MSKTAYEIRLDTLRLAKDILSEDYNYRYNSAAESQNTQRFLKENSPPTTTEIIEKAAELGTYIDN